MLLLSDSVELRAVLDERGTTIAAGYRRKSLQTVARRTSVASKLQWNVSDHAKDDRAGGKPIARRKNGSPGLPAQEGRW